MDGAVLVGAAVVGAAVVGAAVVVGFAVVVVGDEQPLRINANTRTRLRKM
jgi:carbonic anhydrase/acetyltransferase-like protein (isoleucine patch superfamily)